jgi:hypothetical protein
VWRQQLEAQRKKADDRALGKMTPLDEQREALDPTSKTAQRHAAKVAPSPASFEPGRVDLRM